MLKRLLSVLLAAALLIAVVGIIPASAEDTEELAETGGGSSYVCGDYTYGLLEDDTAGIWSYSGSDEELVIPSELDGHTVTYLSWGCFREKDMTSVTIPDTVTIIDSDVFRDCKQLDTVVMSNSITTIRDHAFAGCEVLADIDLPDTVTEMGSGVFDDTLWYAVQPNGVVYAGAVAYALKGSAPQTVNIKNGTVTIANSLFEDNDDIIRVNLPDSLQRIGYDAFKCCENLEDINFPPSLISIDTSAFEDCDALTSIALPASLNELGDRVFHYCDSLETLTVDPACTAFDSRENCNAIIRKSYNMLLMATKNAFVPDGVEIIGRDSFMRNENIKNLDLPESVRVIEGQAFWGCRNLETVRFPSHLESVGDRAFAYCYELADISLPETVTHLDCTSFEDTAWEKAQPEGIIYFGTVAYKYKTGESDIPEVLEFRAGTQYISSCFLRENDDTTTVIFPDSLLEIGEEAFDDCDGLESVSLPDGLTIIGNRAFRNCSDIKGTVTIPDSVTFIGESAFENCDNVTSAVFGRGVNEIAVKAFSCCDSLESIEIPDTITVIGQQAFEQCTSLTTVTIPDTITKIGYMAFEKCSGLETLYLGTGLTFAEYRSFEGCTVDYLFIKDMETFWAAKTSSSGLGFKHLMLNNKAVREITLPENWYSVPAKCFMEWKDLKKITLNDTLESIGSEAFAFCDGLTEITIPANVRTIAVDAFKNCKSLKSLKVDKNNKIYDSRGNCNAIINTPTNILYIGCPGSYIPDTVTEIHSHAFEYCTALTEIRIPSSVTTIGNRAFTGSGLTKIVLPESVTDIDGAFRECEELKDIAIGNPNLSLKNSELGRYEYWDYEIIDNVMHIYKAVKKYDGIVIYGFENSTAQSYANSNGFTFKPWSQRPEEPPVVTVAYLGDADGSGEVDTVDATIIQRYATMVAVPYPEDQLMNADVDSDGDLTIVDATFIQRYSTRVGVPFPIGEAI